MDYFKLLKQMPSNRLAIVEDGIPYSYGTLCSLAEQRYEKLRMTERRIWSEENRETISLYFVRQNGILPQLIDFLAAQHAGKVPVILPYGEEKELEKQFLTLPLPSPKDGICMAVCTSGSRGIPKLYFRTFESWASYFPVQNEIFGVRENSLLFLQGSLSFTGNLNLCLAQFSAGASVIAWNLFAPREWIHAIESWKADMIYLIPSKLMCLPKVCRQSLSCVKNILTGSQSLGKKETELLKQCFPETRVILYYGASELNYITYLTDAQMTEEKNLVGRAFPEVEVSIRGEEIFVRTPYHVWGLTCPYTLSDTGYVDEEGMLHFTGRSDDIAGIRGRKVSTYRIEQELLREEQATDAAVIAIGQEHLLAFVEAPVSGLSKEELRKKQADCLKRLRKTLHPYEIPKRIYYFEELPKNASGKTDKKKCRDLLKNVLP